MICECGQPRKARYPEAGVPCPTCSRITHRCVLCGHVGTDVSNYREHVGGKGFVFRLECDNMPECSARQDRVTFAKNLGEALQEVTDAV